jgi:hypothetical protein
MTKFEEKSRKTNGTLKSKKMRMDINGLRIDHNSEVNGRGDNPTISCGYMRRTSRRSKNCRKDYMKLLFSWDHEESKKVYQSLR